MLGLIVWITMEFAAPEAALPPQFAGLIALARWGWVWGVCWLLRPSIENVGKFYIYCSRADSSMPAESISDCYYRLLSLNKVAGTTNAPNALAARDQELDHTATKYRVCFNYSLESVMEKFYQLLLLSSLCIGPAHSAILTFDDVPGGSIQGTVGNMPTYQGFNFSFTLDWIDLVESSWPFGAHSGDFGILNNNGGVGTITESDLSDFTFDGLWAKQWSTNPESGGSATLLGSISGFNNGLEVWSIATALNGSYQFIGGQAQQIDELHLGFGNIFLVDDIALNQDTNNGVPEPASLALLGIGLAGLGFSRRKA